MGKKLIIKGADFSANGIAPRFEELDFIQSKNETQFIKIGDSNVAEFINPKVRMVIVVGIYGTLPTAGIINVGRYRGTNPGNSLGVSSQYHDGKIKIGCRYGDQTVAQTSTGVYLSSNDRVEVNMCPTGATFKKNGELVYTATYTVGSNTVPNKNSGFCAFGYSNDNVDMIRYPYFVKRLKIYTDYEDDSSLAHDWIPVKKLSDGKVCLYDIVTDKFFYTADGTNPSYMKLDGTFVE